jgi:glycosyltransferase involved in cell wall biosynthesis
MFSQEYESLGIPVFQLGNRFGRWEPFSLIKLIIFVRRYKFDLIHAHLFKSIIFGSLAAKWAGCKVIIHDHSGIYPETLKQYFPFFLFRKAYYEIFRIILNHANLVIVLTTRMYQSYLNHYGEFQEKVQLISNFIDINQYSINNQYKEINNIRNELSVPHNVKFVIMIGRLEKHKDWHTFLRVAKVFQEMDEKHIYFLVVGSGSQKSQLEEFSQYLALRNVFFLGYRTDVRSLLMQSNVFLLTSIKESFPIVLLEAMAAGCPIVSTRSGGPEFILEHGKTGLLADSGDVESLVCNIMQILQYEELRKFIITTAKKVVETNYSYERIRDYLDEIYKKIL